VFQWLGVGGQHCDDFGGINRTSATDTKYRVAARGPTHLGAPRHGGIGGVNLYLDEGMVLGISLMERSGNLVEYSSFFYSRIGHQQQFVDVSTLEFSGQLCECILAEQHLCFLIETEHIRGQRLLRLEVVFAADRLGSWTALDSMG
jgi:hypothetical protein